MRHLGITIATAWLVFTASPLLAATFLDFNSPFPGTLNDVNGMGIGFTDRLPGSGGAIPVNDPNLTLDSGNSRLVVRSTRSDFNTTGFGRNLVALEAPGLKLTGIGTADFLIRAQFLDLHVDQLSDQVGIYAGTSVDNLVRGGVHEGPGGYQSFFTYSQNGTDSDPGGGALNQFTAGQNALLEIGRISGNWYFSWLNLSEPNKGGLVSSVALPNLDASNDLYVGIFNNDARNLTSQFAYLDYFSVVTANPVPEPSSLILVAIGCLGLLACRFQPKLRSPHR